MHAVLSLILLIDRLTLSSPANQVNVTILQRQNLATPQSGEYFEEDNVVSEPGATKTCSPAISLNLLFVNLQHLMISGFVGTQTVAPQQYGFATLSLKLPLVFSGVQPEI